MPKRYAMIGNSATPIKKRYAMIGSTATQVKKRYAMIGSTATLVFSAEELIYTNGTQDHTFDTVKTGSGSGSVTYNSTNMYLTATGSYGTGGYFVSASTISKVDVTDYAKLYVIASGYASDNDGKSYSNANHFCAGLLSSRGASIYEDAVYKMNLNGDSTQQTFELDISSVTGSYYIGVGVSNYRLNNYSNSGYVYKIWLE